jgi:MYXO-CTERM domain-containing protein
MASILYGSSTDTFDGINDIYTIDQTSGLATLLGSSGFRAPFDLTSDWRPDSFTIYAPDSDTNQLLELDPSTGDGTVIGGFGTVTFMESLAFDATTGTLYGLTMDDILYQIDTGTGNATLIGTVGFGSIFAIGFDLSGTLYGVAFDSSELITIDTGSGAGTAVASTTLQGVTDLAARPEDGVMYAVDTYSDAVYTMNLTTGEHTLVGAYNSGVDFMVGLAFSPIPEPAALSLLALGGLLLARRRA